jgi:hypothetical protein
MINLSELIIANPDLDSFHKLLALVRRRAGEGERFLHFDIKPDFVDTPRNWEWRLETAFYEGER